MRKLTGLHGMAYAMLMLASSDHGERIKSRGLSTDKVDEYYRKIEVERRAALEKQLKAERGLKTFVIEGVEIEALNMKNALRKFNNLKK